jgi:3-oxoacyl-[acyl-carrier protein] reductase
VLVQGSVATSSEAARIVEEADAALAGLDTLVNNAGIFPRSPFLELTEAEWDEVHNVNLKGSFVVAQAVARRMITNGRKGAIVNLSSSSVRGHVLGAHYAASKAGIVAFTRNMALEMAPYNITVNAIAPGLTDTAQPRYGMTEEEISEAGGQVPLGRIAEPEDMVPTILFLCGPGGGYNTGQTHHVNGGSWML